MDVNKGCNLEWTCHRSAYISKGDLGSVKVYQMSPNSVDYFQVTEKKKVLQADYLSKDLFSNFYMENIFICFCDLSIFLLIDQTALMKRSSIKGKNLLSRKQIPSFKSDPFLARILLISSPLKTYNTSSLIKPYIPALIYVGV